VLPVGFGLICYRYALFTARDLACLIRGPIRDQYTA